MPNILAATNTRDSQFWKFYSETLIAYLHVEGTKPLS
jgi:hypothetical protein